MWLCGFKAAAISGRPRDDHDIWRHMAGPLGLVRQALGPRSSRAAAGAAAAIPVGRRCVFFRRRRLCIQGRAAAAVGDPADALLIILYIVNLSRHRDPQLELVARLCILCSQKMPTYNQGTRYSEEHRASCQFARLKHTRAADVHLGQPARRRQ